MNDQSKLQNVDMHLIRDHVATGMTLAATNFPMLQLSDLQRCGPDVNNDKLPGKIKSQLLCIGTTHMKMSQLNCQQDVFATGLYRKLVNTLQQIVILSSC